MKQVIFMVLLTLTGTAGVVVVRPFLGVAVYYLFAVLRPQYLWQWSLPADVTWSFYVALATLLAAGTALFGAGPSGSRLSFTRATARYSPSGFGLVFAPSTRTTNGLLPVVRGVPENLRDVCCFRPADRQQPRSLGAGLSGGLGPGVCRLQGEFPLPQRGLHGHLPQRLRRPGQQRRRPDACDGDPALLFRLGGEPWPVALGLSSIDPGPAPRGADDLFPRRHGLPGGNDASDLAAEPAPDLAVSGRFGGAVPAASPGRAQTARGAAKARSKRPARKVAATLAPFTPVQRFWQILIVAVVARIAVVGERDPLGVGHLTLLSLQVVGLAMLAAVVPWRRGILTLVILAGCAVDFSCGVLLQAHGGRASITARRAPCFPGWNLSAGRLANGRRPGPDALSQSAWSNWFS